MAKGCRPWRERDHACSDAAARTRAPGEHWMRAARRRVVIGGATGKTSLRHKTCMLGRDAGAPAIHGVPRRPSLRHARHYSLAFPVAPLQLCCGCTFPINGSAAGRGRVPDGDEALSCSARPLNEEERLLARSQIGHGRNGRQCSSSTEISPDFTVQEALLVVPMQNLGAKFSKNCTKTILFKPWLQVQYMLLRDEAHTDCSDIHLAFTLCNTSSVRPAI